MNIYNLLILDESGSMSVIRSQALSTLNETIQTIRQAQSDNAEQKHFVSLVTFCNGGMSGVKVILDRVPAAEVRELNENDYSPTGCTPLYDAMGFSINVLDKAVSAEDKVLVTIITDGMENSSENFTASQIKDLVARQRAKGWTLAYVGANQDAIEVARDLNIKNALNYDANEEGMRNMKFKVCHSMTRVYRKMEEEPGALSDMDDFFEDKD